MPNSLIKYLALTYCLTAPAHSSPSAQIAPVFRNLFLDQMATPVDVDDDGDLDLVFGGFDDTTPRSNTSAVCYNDGNGQFSEPFAIDYRMGPNGDTTLIGIRNPGEAIAIHRQKVTLISGSPSSSEMLRIPFSKGAYLSQYDASELLGGENTYCKTGGKIDQDDYLDYLLKKNGKFIISLGNSGGEQELFTTDNDNEFSKLIALTDIDGNSHKDIIYEGEHNGENGICVISQTSSRSFSSPSILKTTSGSSVDTDATKLADLDGNGMLDLHGTNGNTFKYHLQTASGFAPLQSVTHNHELEEMIGIIEKTGESAKYLYAHRDEQSKLEIHQIVYDAPSSPIISYCLNDLLPQGDAITPSFFYHAQHLHDINADGIKDIILPISLDDSWKQPYQWSMMNRLCIGTGQPDGSFIFTWQGEPPLSSYSVTKGRFSQIVRNDLIVGSAPLRELVLLSFSSENGWERKRVLTELLPANYKSAGVSIDRIYPVDVNNNGYSDLVVRYRRPSSENFLGYTYYCGIAINSGSSTFTLPEPLPADFLNGLTDHDCLIFDFADWDGDGDLDAMAHGYGWYENTGNKFSPNLRFLAGGATAIDALGNPITLAGEGCVSDIDGDGSLDFFIPATGHHDPFGFNPNGASAPSSTQAAILYGNGSGGISQIIYYPISLVSSDAFGNPITLDYAVKDMNLDGKQDIIYSIPIIDALGTPLAQYHIAYNSPNGRFQPFQSLNVVSAIKGLQEGDYNGDGVIDLCRINDYSSPSPSGIEVSPNYRYFTTMGINTFLEMFDVDDDHDGDFLFTPTAPHEGLFVGINPTVDGANPVVRHALDAGLRATDTLPSADPENDHITNLEEYMFGGNPAMVDNSNILPQLRVDTAVSPPRLTAVFKRRKSLPVENQYFIRLSQDLSSWMNYPLDTVSPTSIDETWEQLDLSIDILDYFPEAQKGFIDWAVE